MEPDADATTPEQPWFDAWRGVLFASARVLRLADLDLLEHDGFPLTWLDVLAQLADAGPAGLRMQELEEVALFNRGGLTRLVDRIEAAGMVRREPVPGDRRGVLVVLTDDGRRRHDAAFARHRTLVEREFGRRLSTAQHRAVARALWSFWHAGGDSPAAGNSPVDAQAGEPTDPASGSVAERRPRRRS